MILSLTGRKHHPREREMNVKGIRYMKTVGEKTEYVKVFSEAAGFGEVSYWYGTAHVVTVESELTGGNHRGAIIIRTATLLVYPKAVDILLEALREFEGFSEKDDLMRLHSGDLLIEKETGRGFGLLFS